VCCAGCTQPIAQTIRATAGESPKRRQPHVACPRAYVVDALAPVNCRGPVRPIMVRSRRWLEMDPVDRSTAGGHSPPSDATVSRASLIRDRPNNAIRLHIAGVPCARICPGASPHRDASDMMNHMCSTIRKTIWLVVDAARKSRSVLSQRRITPEARRAEKLWPGYQDENDSATPCRERPPRRVGVAIEIHHASSRLASPNMWAPGVPRVRLHKWGDVCPGQKTTRCRDTFPRQAPALWKVRENPSERGDERASSRWIAPRTGSFRYPPPGPADDVKQCVLPRRSADQAIDARLPMVSATSSSATMPPNACAGPQPQEWRDRPNPGVEPSAQRYARPHTPRGA